MYRHAHSGTYVHLTGPHPHLLTTAKKTISQAWWGRLIILGSLEAETRVLQIPGLPGLHSRFKASLGNSVRTFLIVKGEKWALA